MDVVFCLRFDSRILLNWNLVFVDITLKLPVLCFCAQWSCNEEQFLSSFCFGWWPWPSFLLSFPNVWCCSIRNWWPMIEGVFCTRCCSLECSLSLDEVMQCLPRLEFSLLDILPRIPFESVPWLNQSGGQNVLPYLTTICLELWVFPFLLLFFMMTLLWGFTRREGYRNLESENYSTEVELFVFGVCVCF